jgi:hypothetical protein
MRPAIDPSPLLACCAPEQLNAQQDFKIPNKSTQFFLIFPFGVLRVPKSTWQAPPPSRTTPFSRELARAISPSTLSTSETL